MNRRKFLFGMCAGGVATLAAPLWSFARLPGRGRLVFVLLRGAMDGLASVVPYGDPRYTSARGSLAFPREELTRLDDLFALPPGLAPLAELWQANELALTHAMSIPYRTRSHFDAQAVLETGLSAPSGAADGWLNRLLQIMEGKRSGLAIAAGLPRSLDGEFPVATWAPSRLGVTTDAYVDRLHLLYRDDRALADPFEAALLLDSTVGEPASGRDSDPAASRESRSPRPGQGGGSLMAAAARLLRAPDGPNVAALELSGWDTHVGQGVVAGALDRRLAVLAEGILALRAGMGEVWNRTTVVVMTEFGRTARPNGSGGTDHGTAGAGFVIGPRVARSRVFADWPGLSEKELFEGRDLRPTLDTRAVLKAVIASTFELTTSQVHRVFPESTQVEPAFDLMV